jgi:hypothetical protein
MGYVRGPGGEVVFDPDEQVRSVVRLVFEQFERLGTVRKVHRYFIERRIRVGIRPRMGADVEWREPTRDAIASTLHHPVYAGYDCFGRTRTDARLERPGKRGSGRRSVSPDQYLVLLPDRCAAYVSKERFEANQKRLAENRARMESNGAPRRARGPPCWRVSSSVAGAAAGWASTTAAEARASATSARRSRRSVRGRCDTASLARGWTDSSGSWCSRRCGLGRWS